MNLSGKHISRSVVASVFQVSVSGLVFFILYRFLYDQLGIEKIGIWSLVLATASVSRIGDLGLSAGVVKFVAQAMSTKDTQRAANIIQTVALTLGVFLLVLLLIAYPLFVLGLSYILPVGAVPLALKILPYALISLWIMVLVSVISGGLDGCVRMYVKSILLTISHIIYLLLAIYLVPKYGLEGVAMAQLIQSIGLLVMLWLALRQLLKELPVVPIYWKISVLKEMFRYGLNFQAITVMNMMFDPLIKAIMSKFGGLESLGFYEMANRLILQGRSLIVEGGRVLVPLTAIQYQQDKARIKTVFLYSYNLTFYISVLFFGAMGASMTAISYLWLGHYQTTFIQFALLLNLAWFVNTLINPAYFSNLGTGNLKPNLIAHALIATIASLFGIMFGYNLGGLGVVFGVVLGIFFGSIYLLSNYFKGMYIHWLRELVPNNMWILMLIAIIIAFYSNYGWISQKSTFSSTLLAFICIVTLMLFGWFNPSRKKVFKAIYNARK